MDTDIAPASAPLFRRTGFQATTGPQENESTVSGQLSNPTPIKRLLVANRGEIAIRIFRACGELNIHTVAIYSWEDRNSPHRYKANEAYLVGAGKSPIQAYLAYADIVALAKREKVDAIHPGYGFLSENYEFAALCRENGIIFVGPDPESIDLFGDKTKAREVAQKAGVPIVPGSGGALKNAAECIEFADKIGFPVMLKAAMGGGGRGMRIVRNKEDIEEAFIRCSSEALVAFGDGTMFMEKYIENPRHIEVQILADRHGNVVHLFERDCSVQRRHQKVVEIAPANCIAHDLRMRICEDAVKLAKSVEYKNAGTVEFLVSGDKYYFIEVNPRVQVEHTITEEITGVDIVLSQIKIAGGARLSDLNIFQETVSISGSAIQCRVTTEDAERGLQPDFGRITVYRSAGGRGVRLDGGPAYVGAVIGQHYDSLLVKVIAHSRTFHDTIRVLLRALGEMRIKGVKTNLKFLRNVLSNPTFLSGLVFTNFIESTPELFHFKKAKFTAHKILQYLGDVVVNGCRVSGADPAVSLPKEDPIPPTVGYYSDDPPDSWRKIFVTEGPEALMKAVRAHPRVLITDTTWRDAHQSLLATRMRTIDLANIATQTSHVLAKAFSLEMWGGATFDVCLRFLHECPWKRLRELRKECPNILFQMLLRGANGVGYTAYPDNVIYEFVKHAKDAGVDVFRVFDSLNYMENLKLGIDAVRAAGGIVEAAICYTGDVCDPARTKYNMDYYMNFAKELVSYGTHILAIKDMAGLLKPQAATKLIGALRKAYPDIPIHLHTHDTAGTGLATYIAAAEAGADVVDCAIDAMSGLTSQPSMGAFVNAMMGHPLDTQINPASLTPINDYWELVRRLYSPFESAMRAGSSDVFIHEMPGGQYTNLQFQAMSLGLGQEWPKIKLAYADANQLLGDIIKVTPSSKVVGDLAQFMVANKLTKEAVVEQAAFLSFPNSVVEYFQGLIGIPPGGFPEPLCSRVLRGKSQMKGRPGASMPPMDLVALKESLLAKYKYDISDEDVMSAALYPKVFEEYMKFKNEFGEVSNIPTRYFLSPLQQGEELAINLGRGHTIYVKLIAIGETDKKTGKREVYFEMNGTARSIVVDDLSAKDSVIVRKKATSAPGSVGAPMSGSVVDVRVKVGSHVRRNDPLAVLSAMKMETVVSSPVSGVVAAVEVMPGDSLNQNDLILEIDDRVKADPLERTS